MWLLARLGLFTNQNDRLISLLLIHILQLVNSQPFLIPEPEKSTPFGLNLLVQAQESTPGFHDEFSLLCARL